MAIADEFTNAPPEYFVNRIVRPIGDFHNVYYIVCWYSYMSVDVLVELPEHIPEHFSTLNLRGVQNNDVVRQRRRRADINKE